MSCFVVTGGAGFIGCNFVRAALARGAERVVVFDKLTYAGHLENLAELDSDARFVFVRGDIASREELHRLFNIYEPDVVVNFAAESHVDRSIDDPSAFVRTNIVGTHELLEAARALLARLPRRRAEAFRFLHVSTDEVYGSLGPEGSFSEESPYAPNSPYAASKAAADHLVRAYHATYALPTLLTNCSNNYGPFQFPEKLIPLMTLNAVEGRELPIYGDGAQVRDWLQVKDHCEGLLLALERGRPGRRYNLGGHGEMSNLELVDRLCETLEELMPAKANRSLQKHGVRSYHALRRFVTDRPAHDRRYAIDATRAREELGWSPRHTLVEGLRATVRWYLEHRDWCRAVQPRGDERDRLGVGAGEE